MVRRLDQGLRNLAERLREDLGRDPRALPGGGAAGGLGAGLAGFFGATLRSGIDIVLDLVHFDEALAYADLVLTGEGCLDSQTVHGKAPAGVAMRARRHGVPCVAIAGCLRGDLTELYNAGLTSAFPLCGGPMSLEDCMANAPALLRDATSRIMRIVRQASGRVALLRDRPATNRS